MRMLSEQVLQQYRCLDGDMIVRPWLRPLDYPLDASSNDDGLRLDLFLPPQQRGHSMMSPLRTQLSGLSTVLMVEGRLLASYSHW